MLLQTGISAADTTHIKKNLHIIWIFIADKNQSVSCVCCFLCPGAAGLSKSVWGDKGQIINHTQVKYFLIHFLHVSYELTHARAPVKAMETERWREPGGL